MKVKDVMVLQSKCDEFSDMLKACIHDHGVVELPENDADSLEKFLEWAHDFISETIKNTEVFK